MLKFGKKERKMLCNTKNKTYKQINLFHNDLSKSYTQEKKIECKIITNLKLKLRSKNKRKEK